MFSHLPWSVGLDRGYHGGGYARGQTATLTLVTGLYGTNFDTMPELAWPLGYPVVFLGMVAVSVILVAYFKRERYI